MMNVIIIPRRKSKSIGAATNHIVIPVPSGAITAAKITIMIITYLRLFVVTLQVRMLVY